MRHLACIALSALALSGCGFVTFTDTGEIAIVAPVATSPETTPSSTVCTDPDAFTGTIAGADTVRLRGCAFTQVFPGFRLVLTDGAPADTRLTLTIERGGRPLEGAHAVGLGTGVATIPHVPVTLADASEQAVYSQITGTMTITRSEPSVMEGTIRLSARQSRARTSSDVRIDVSFVARCTTVHEQPCF